VFPVKFEHHLDIKMLRYPCNRLWGLLGVFPVRYEIIFFLFKSWVTQKFITIKTSWNTNGYEEWCLLGCYAVWLL
jgi:hypothetical protein